jgi:hypothetical protein
MQRQIRDSRLCKATNSIEAYDVYPNSGDQHNFINATQGVDVLVNAFESAISCFSPSDDSEDFYVHASDYNALVDQFNQLARRAAWLEKERHRVFKENSRLMHLLGRRTG